MTRILFVCHGNICRSPMAEFVMKKIVSDRNMSERFFIASAATSREEEGNPMHYGTRRKLKEKGVPFENHYATVIKRSDYEKYDYIIAMERYNIRGIMRIIGSDPEHKVSLLLDYTRRPGDIADPWYTGNFDKTYEDILEGCQGLLEALKTREPELFRA